MGRDGGQTAGALQWIMDNGGIALESSYHYLMQVCVAAVATATAAIMLLCFVCFVLFRSIGLMMLF